jgi:hypothetical protein
MTSKSVNPSPEARGRMDAYLDAIERVLVAADMPRAERKGITDDVEAQVLEMLSARGGDEPTVADVEAVLAQLDPPDAYAEAGGAPRVARAGAPPAALPRKADRPHFSRAAIVGACWAPLALALMPLVLLHLWPMTSSSNARHHVTASVASEQEASTEEAPAGAATEAEGEAADEAAAAKLKQEAALARHRAELQRQKALSGVQRQTRLSWFGILIFAPLGLLGLSAPFGTTILGLVAIGHIRRSGGRIYGMGLAVFDALLFPLLVLDGLMVLCAALLHDDLTGSLAWAVVVGLVLAVVADVVIAWLVWRALRGTPGEAAETKKTYRTLGILSLALCLVGVLQVMVPMVGRGFVGQPSFLALLGCEIAALVCGIIAWRATPLAKAGTVTSSVLMALSFLLWA